MKLRTLSRRGFAFTYGEDGLITVTGPYPENYITFRCYCEEQAKVLVDRMADVIKEEQVH